MNKIRRWHRLFQRDGRTFIVALDHGTNAGALPGLERPEETILKMAASGVDAVIVNYGVARKFARELSGLGVILRLDISPTAMGQGHASRLAYGVEEALRLGADAVIVNAGPGVGVEEITLPQLADIARRCDNWGLPLIGEISPGGFDSDPSLRTLDNIALGARIACELGADAIKTIYRPGFRAVTETCFVPVVVLGGAKTNDVKAFLASIKDALDEGAAGVAIGRNVWGHPRPEKMAAALAALIHKGATLEEAQAILES
ncbi:MAG: deoxyribose-phosphate aldolase [Thermoanaerobacteraceae bacterium]|nr:deoxyribose-phosphate aldolase [Thermoanaerobacteraceae bacterium]